MTHAGASPGPSDATLNRVVVALVSGRRERGFIYDINPVNPDFHLFPTEDPAETRAEVFRLEDCKAIYFVKSFTGNPHYRENKTRLPEKKRFGRAFEVLFPDGERIVGTVESYHSDRLGFYLLPPDPNSNNRRIFVVQANAREVRPLAELTGDGTDGTWTLPDLADYPAEKRVEIVRRLLNNADHGALARESYLPLPVLLHWKDRFTEGGREALTDEALSRAAESREGAWKPHRSTPEQRLEVVLRLFAREDASVISQILLAPFKVLVEWRDRFLAGGEAAVRDQAVAESREDPAAVRARYEALVGQPRRAG